MKCWRQVIRSRAEHYPRVGLSTSLRYAQGERLIPARAEPFVTLRTGSAATAVKSKHVKMDRHHQQSVEGIALSKTHCGCEHARIVQGEEVESLQKNTTSRI
jgi:hypothetical protein